MRLRLPTLSSLVTAAAQALEVVEVKRKARVILKWSHVVYLRRHCHASFSEAFLAEVVISLQGHHACAFPRDAFIKPLLFEGRTIRHDSHPNNYFADALTPRVKK